MAEPAASEAVGNKETSEASSTAAYLVGNGTICESSGSSVPADAADVVSISLETPSPAAVFSTSKMRTSSGEQCVGSSWECPVTGAHDDREVLKSWLTGIFTQHQPDSMPDIEHLMAMYTNNEREMIEMIVSKHGRDRVRAPSGWESAPAGAAPSKPLATPSCGSCRLAAGKKSPGPTSSLERADTTAAEEPFYGTAKTLEKTEAVGSAGVVVKAPEAEAGQEMGLGSGLGEESPGTLKSEGAKAENAAGSKASVTPANPDRFDWMPTLQRSKPSRECIQRLRNDMRSIMREPIPGLFVCPDEDLVTVVHALVTGPFDTPYEGGFFYFVMHYPDDYPHSPPRVRLMTTGGGTVRFNPNFYANGKVCLSILGTWSGPRWTPVLSISSVLLSIQSLMTEKPYHNEPGFETASNPRDVRDYGDCITHETLRVAVCTMVEDSSLWRSMPECFQGLTRDLFVSFVPRYEIVCEQNMHRDGEKMIDPFGHNKGVFRYAAILCKIKRLESSMRPASRAATSKEGEVESDRSEGKDAGATGAAADAREADVIGNDCEIPVAGKATAGADIGQDGRAIVEGARSAGATSNLSR